MLAAALIINPNQEEVKCLSQVEERSHIKPRRSTENGAQRIVAEMPKVQIQNAGLPQTVKGAASIGLRRQRARIGVAMPLELP